MNKNLVLASSALAIMVIASAVIFVLLTPNQSSHTVVVQPLASVTVATITLHAGDKLDFSYTTSGPSNETITLQSFGLIGHAYVGGATSASGSGVYPAGTYEFNFTNPSSVSPLTVEYNFHKQQSLLMTVLLLGLVDAGVALVALGIWARGRSKTN